LLSPSSAVTGGALPQTASARRRRTTSVSYEWRCCILTSRTMNPRGSTREKKREGRGELTGAKSNPHPAYPHREYQLELDHRARRPRSKNPRGGKEDEDEGESGGSPTRRTRKGRDVGLESVESPSPSSRTAQPSPPLRLAGARGRLASLFLASASRRLRLRLRSGG